MPRLWSRLAMPEMSHEVPIWVPTPRVWPRLELYQAAPMARPNPRPALHGCEASVRRTPTVGPICALLIDLSDSKCVLSGCVLPYIVP